MGLEVKPGLAPMEAASVERIPEGSGWQYEPKWDGFRCLVFRDGNKVELQSKSGQSLTRYFPEMVEAFRALKPPMFVLDGELVVPEDRALSFDALLMRLHPAESRVRKLARETPAWFIAFDLLCDSRGKSLVNLRQDERRTALETFTAKYFPANGSLKLSPATTDLAQARHWLASVGGTLDGVIAKPLVLQYRPGERAIQKIKLLRTADCVVGGFRYAEKDHAVGSLLLGLYDGDGLLNHVGFCSGLKASDRPALTRRLEALVKPPGFTGRAPGGPSRWTTKRSTEWQPLEPKLVVEVGFDHISAGRFRHGTRLIRWRPDKKPSQCRMDQLQQKSGRLENLLKR